MGATVAAKNRKVRQEALRDQLEAQGHVQHAYDILNKIKDLNGLDETAEFDLKKYSKALDGHWKFIDKYLPTEKPSTIEGLGDNGEIVVKWMS